MKHHLRALLGELRGLSLNPRVQTLNGGHVRLEWDVGEKTYFLVTSATPSDRRTVQNARADLRRRLRAAGFYPDTAEPKAAPAGSSINHLRNELVNLRRHGDRAAVHIRAVEVELAWRQHAQTNGGAR